MNETYSLDYFYEQFRRPLIEILTDPTNEPLINIMEEEAYKELVKNIKQSLSRRENDVLGYMISGFNYQQIAKITGNTPKQIDNTIQRIKQKIKNIIDKNNN